MQALSSVQDNPFAVTNTNDSGAGSLRQALNNALFNPGVETIVFTGDVFTDSTPDTIVLTSGQFELFNDVNIQGPGANLLTLSGNNASRIFLITAANSTIAGLTLTGGTATPGNNGEGGAILFGGNGTLTLNDITFANNRAIAGGGITNAGFGRLNIANSQFTNNTASANGGAIHNLNGALTLTDSSLENNTAANGGAIANLGSLSTTNSSFTTNTATGSGGGIANYRNLSIVNGSFNDNSAEQGGGIANFASLSLAGSIFTGNSARSDGGGIFNGPGFQDNSTISTIVNTVITRNTSDSNADGSGNGGGIYNIPGSITTLQGDTILNNFDTPNNSGSGVIQPNLAGAFTFVVTNTNDSGAGSLRQAILDANGTMGGDSIVFAGVFSDAIPDTIALTTGELAVTDSLTIVGSGLDRLRISGSDASRIFSVSNGATLNLSGLTLSNGAADSGAAIQINRTSTVNLTDSVVTTNVASADGGAVFVDEAASLALLRSNLVSNVALTDGGAIASRGSVTLNNSNVVNNRAINGGGIANQGTVTLTGSTVNRNQASNNGGGVWNNGTLTATNSAFMSNVADSDADGVGGAGGIFNSGTTLLSNSTFSANADTPNNAGQNATQPNLAGVFTFVVSNTRDNGFGSLRQALLDANANPGADSIVFDGLFADAIADVITLSTGELVITDDVTITGTGANLLTISGNNASRVFAIAPNVTATISGLTMTAGDSSLSGGGIANGGTLTLDTVNVVGNRAALAGGGITNTGRLTLINSAIADNTASSGGGIANSANSSLTLNSSTVNNNAALTSGGGIANSGTLSLTDSAVRNNVADSDTDGIGDGGGIFSIAPGATPGTAMVGDTQLLTAGTTATLINSPVTGNIDNSDRSVLGAVQSDLVGDFTIEGTANNDVLSGGSGNDTIDGKDGDDELWGQSGNDTLVAGSGNDLIRGGHGDDLIDAGAGDDQIRGGRGNDRLLGGAGNDRYVFVADGILGSDVLTDSEGNNFLDFSEMQLSSVTVDLNRTDAQVINSFLTLALTPGTRMTRLSGGRQADSLTGNGDDNQISGNGGSDVLNGGGGNDSLTGGEGRDSFIFAASTDFAASNLGIDTLTDFVAGTDRIVLSKTTFALTSTTGNGFSVSEEFSQVVSDRDAETSSALIVYSSETGKLFYNQNGTESGFGTGGQFALLSGIPNLRASDFVLQA